MLLLSSSFKDWTSIICDMASWQRNLNTDFAYRVGIPTQIPSVNFHMICLSRTPLATCIRPRSWIPERITMLFIIGIIAACDRSVQLENLSIFEQFPFMQRIYHLFSLPSSSPVQLGRVHATFHARILRPEFVLLARCTH